MKKMTVALLVVMAIILSGCTVAKMGEKTSEKEILQEFGLVYTNGVYTLKGAYASGFLTSNQTIIRMGIPLGKRLLEEQEVTITSVTETYLRADGKYILGEKADLTPYISGTSIRNDGAILFVQFKNPDKWTGANGKTITNNTPIAGTFDIEFTVS